MVGALSLCPVTREEARLFVKRHHRHGPVPPPADIFRMAVHDGEEIRGVAIVGNPVARLACDGRTVEVNRLCVLDGYPNAASMLLGACKRAAWALGYTRLVTFTLQSEPGSSLRAAGFRIIAERADQNWNRPGRPRVERNTGPKFKWEALP